MKKKFIISGLILCAVLFMLAMVHNSDVEVENSQVFSTVNGCDYYVTAVANRLYIGDRELFAKELIQKCLNNSFEDVKFSYDINEYPASLQITVFANRLFYNCKTGGFIINVTQDFPYQYNLRDNPEKFKMEIVDYPTAQIVLSFQGSG